MQKPSDSARKPPSRNYRVSKLAPSSAQDYKADALPLIKIKSRPDNIVIPSVHKSTDLSPRSLDSRSLEDASISSLSQRMTPKHGSRGHSKHLSRSTTFQHPVQIASDGGAIEITLEDGQRSRDLPNVRLDMLDSLLPKDLRNANKFKQRMHEKLRAIQLNEQNGTTNKLSKLFHDERIVSNDYHPVHHSSGAVSITNLSHHSIDSFDDPLPTSQAAAIPSTIKIPTKNKKLSQSKGALWGGDEANEANESLIAREERNNMRFFLDDLERSLKEHNETEAEKQREEREIILKLKVVNTLFDQKVSLSSALIAAVKRANALRNEEENEQQQQQQQQSLEDAAAVADQQIVAEEERLKAERAEQDAVNEAIARSMELEQATVLKFKTTDFDNDSHSGDEDDDDHSILGDETGENSRVPSVDGMDGTAMDDERYQRRLRKKMLKRAILASAHDTTQQNPNSDIVNMIANMSVRKMREKLRNLAKFINSHTSRKIMNGWNIIEGRFKAPTYSKTVMQLDSRGLTHPVKCNAIFVSTLTSLLCSAKLKIGHHELYVILEKLGFTEDEILHARQVAALNLVISYDSEAKTKQTMQYKLDLQILMRQEERLVSINKLTDVIFPTDETERAAEFERIHANKLAETQAMFEEKKKKEENREKLEIRRKKLIRDFEETLQVVQLFKGEYTRQRHNDFAYLIKYCKKTIDQHYEDESNKISPEVMSYIGMDAFPQNIQDKVRNKRDKPMTPSITGGVNPFLRPKPINTADSGIVSGSGGGASRGTTPAAGGAVTPSAAAMGTGTTPTGRAVSGTVSPGTTPTGRAVSGTVSPGGSRQIISNQASGVSGGGSVTSVGSAGSGSTLGIAAEERPSSRGASGATPSSSGRQTVRTLSGNKKVSPSATPRAQTMLTKTVSSVPPVVEDTPPQPPPRSVVVPRDKIQLSGPPTILSVLRECVSFGRGLSGYPYRDVVATLQYIAVTKLCAAFRCYSRRWRYTAARRNWQRIDLSIKTEHYNAWVILTKHSSDTREHCWRKLKAWNFYLRRVKYRRNLFRQCFWPFYTWRKYTDACATAKEKAHFLVHRVMPTVLTIKVFKAWKTWAQYEKKLNDKADRNYTENLHKEFRNSFIFFHDWARRRRFLSRAWFRRGASMRKDCLFRAKIRPFQMWLVYTKYRKMIRRKLRAQFYAFMRHLWKRIRHLKRLSTSDRRILSSTKRTKRSSHGKRRPSNASKPGSSQGSRKPSSAQIGHPRSREGRSKPGSSHGGSRSKPGSRGSSRGGTRSRGGSVSDGGSGSESGMVFHDDSSVAGSTASGAEDDESAVKQTFNWKADTTPYFDIDSDGEDDEDIPPLLYKLYDRTVQIQSPIPPPDKAFPFIETAERCVVDHAETFCTVYKYVDVWNTFEASCRYHRMAYRVFNNFRHYARIKRHVRKYLKRTRLATKKKFFEILRKNMKNMVRRASVAANSQTLADQLATAVRTHTVSKLMRMRKATAEVNKVLGRDDDDDDADDEEKAAQRIKNLNLISEDNDDEYIAAENKRRKDRQLEMKIKNELVKNNANLPDLLEWDRADRDIEESLAIKMVQFSKNTRNQTLEKTVEADAASREIVAKEEKLAAVIHEVFAQERGITETAVANQELYVSKFKIHAADNLITTLAKIYVAVQVSLLKEESRLYFRALRIPMLLARSRSMYRRKKLMNWIRICLRLNSIYRHVGDYYTRKRTKWCIFNRWLKYIEIEKLNPTPGLVNTIRRKVQLHPDYNNLLKERGFQQVVYVNNSRLNQVVSEFSALFHRWKSYTQEEILFRIMEDKVHSLYILTLKQKIFYALKTGLKIKDILLRISLDAESFPIVRLRADLNQITKKFISMRRKGLTAVIARYNRKFISKLKTEGKTALSFKRFMVAFENETSARISTEQRILSESFEMRGKQEFYDLRVPNRTDPIMPPIMQKLDGKPFSDPHSISSDGRENAVPGGFKLHKLKFTMLPNAGIIGWQCIWGADGARDLEGQQRGLWNAAAMTVHEFTIPKDDFLMGIEYMYDGGTIVGVRLKLLFKGFTGWIGGKTSLSTLSVYLGSEIAPKLIFEADRDRYLDADEKESPAMPSSFIVGLTGLVNNNRATCMGIVVRKIKKQNLFSYHYVQDVVSRMHFERSEFGAAGDVSQTMTLDQKSIPSQISGGLDGQANQLNGDSLTMSVHDGDSDVFGIGIGGAGGDADGDGDDDSSQEGGGGDDDDNNSAYHSMGSLDDDDSATTATGATGYDSQVSSANGSHKPKYQPRKRRHGVLAKEGTFEGGGEENPLMSSEEQFFDVLRMRTTELSSAVDRTMEFARRIWTDRDIRCDPRLGRLISIRIVSQLARWYFNTLSKRLIKVSATEKQGLQMIKTAKSYQYQAIKIMKRSQSTMRQARAMERAPQSWTGKSMLAPTERALKKDYMDRVKALKDTAVRLDHEAQDLRCKVVEFEKNGYALLPRIALSQYIVNNYKVKIAAARHKESLLERMTLDEVKTGLFGNTKENLLNKEQMQAVHQSLKNQKIVLKDTSSLERLIENVLEEEAAELMTEEDSAYERLYGPGSSAGRRSRSRGGGSGGNRNSSSSHHFARSSSSGRQQFLQARNSSISTASQTLSLGSGPPPQQHTAAMSAHKSGSHHQKINKFTSGHHHHHISSSSGSDNNKVIMSSSLKIPTGSGSGNAAAAAAVAAAPKVPMINRVNRRSTLSLGDSIDEDELEEQNDDHHYSRLPPRHNNHATANTISTASSKSGRVLEHHQATHGKKAVSLSSSLSGLPAVKQSGNGGI